MPDDAQSFPQLSEGQRWASMLFIQLGKARKVVGLYCFSVYKLIYNQNLARPICQVEVQEGYFIQLKVGDLRYKYYHAYAFYSINSNSKKIDWIEFFLYVYNLLDNNVVRNT